MEVDNPQVDDLPDSAVVDAEEPTSEPLADEALPDESTETPATKEPAQEKPKGDEPAEGDQPKGETDEEGDEPDPKDEPKSGKDAPRGRKNAAQKRIDRLTRQRSEAEREAAYWRGQAEALAAAQKGEGPQPDPKPKLEDYDSAEDYADALADWKIAQQDAAPSGSQQEPTGSPAETAPQPTEAAVKSYTAAKLKYTDLDDVLFDSSLPWTTHIADAVADEEDSAEILYHLGQDEEALERISQLPPKQQEREVWRFAEQLRARLGNESPADAGTETETDDEPGDEPAPQTTAKPRAAVSRAQPVPSTVTGRASTTKPVEEMSDAEYCAYMDRKEREARSLGG